jgi:cyclin C
MLISEMNSYMIVHQPYRSLADIQVELSLSQDETALAWSVINDHYLTDLPLLYPPHIIAVTATFMAVALKPKQINTSGSSAASNSAAVPSNSAVDSISSSLAGKSNGATSSKVEQMVSWLAQTNIDMDAVIDCTQEIVSLYEILEQYNDKVCKEQIARYIKNRGLEK